MAELRAYNPTFRERSTQYVANLLRDKFGMDNYRSYDLARDIFGDESSPTMLGSMGIADFTPAGAIFGGQEGARMYQRSDDLVGKGLGAGIVGLSALEGLGPLGLAIKAGRKVLPKTAAPDNPDLQRRAVVKGLAALPVATTAVAKGIADLPIGAAAKAAKAVPNITGSKLLDSLPFVREKLSKVYDGVLKKSSDNYVNMGLTEEKLYQNLYHLDDMSDAIDRLISRYENSPQGMPKNLGEIADLDFDTTKINVDALEDEPVEMLNSYILLDFMKQNKNLDLFEARRLIHEEKGKIFTEAYKQGGLEDSILANTLKEKGPGSLREFYGFADDATPDEIIKGLIEKGDGTLDASAVQMMMNTFDEFYAPNPDNAAAMARLLAEDAR
jgi:hypothetical protein|tara:strand:+ start:34488 stop:35642 length:1155 start_codon:yes stop_codon:yes gene_type:complete